MVAFTGERKSAAELAADRLVLLDEAEAIAKLREGKNSRDLTPEEQARFDEITADGGLADQLLAEVDSATKFENLRRQRREAQLSASMLNDPNRRNNIGRPTGSSANAVAHASGDVDPNTATLAGLWFTAAANGANAQEAREQLDRAGFGEYATLTTTNPSSGGLAVPDPIANEIILHRDKVSVLPMLARKFMMSSNNLTIPRELTRPQSYYPGEGGAITPSEGSIDDYVLEVVKRAILVRSTYEALKDTVSVFGGWIVESMGYEMAHTMDREALNGDGSATFGGETGLIPAVGSAGVENGAGPDLSDLTIANWTATMARLAGRYHRNAGWIMSYETWNNSVLPLMATAGGSGFASLMAGAPGEKPKWLGKPVYLTDLMPTAGPDTVAALFGDFRQALFLGERGDLRFDSTPYEQFDRDIISYRTLHRYDWLVAEPGDATDAGAYVALKLAAS